MRSLVLRDSTIAPSCQQSQLYDRWKRLTSQSSSASFGPSSTLIKTPVERSHTYIWCEVLVPAPPITYSPSPLNPTVFQGVFPIVSWNRCSSCIVIGTAWGSPSASARPGMITYTRTARSLELMTMYRPVRSKAICLIRLVQIFCRQIIHLVRASYIHSIPSRVPAYIRSPLRSNVANVKFELFDTNAQYSSAGNLV